MYINIYTQTKNLTITTTKKTDQHIANWFIFLSSFIAKLKKGQLVKSNNLLSSQVSQVSRLTRLVSTSGIDIDGDKNVNNNNNNNNDNKVKPTKKMKWPLKR